MGSSDIADTMDSFHVEHEDPVDPLARLLVEGLRALGLSEEAAPRLAGLACLVASWAERTNLTAHRGAESIARMLILEALALGAALPLAPPATLVDLGSGAGFPGLPLAIVWPPCSVTLVESRERKNHFQRHAIRTLGIGNATARRGRAEVLEPELPLGEIVIAQAMAEPARALGWMQRWLAPGGWLVLPRSEDAPGFVPPAGVRLEGTRDYQVPLGGRRRSLWLARRRTP